MSRGGGGVVPGDVGFPRVSGDEPAMALNLQGTPKFSPRERG